MDTTYQKGEQYEDMDRHKTKPTNIQRFRAQNMEDALQQVGAFGCYQIVMSVIFSLMVTAMAFHPAIMYFVTITPPWKCARNSTVCKSSETFPAGNMTRCSYPRREWMYTEPSDYSLVTEFQLDCDRTWLINLLTSLFFLGWSSAGIPLGLLADNFGRKPVLMISLLVELFVGLVTAFLPNFYFFAISRLILGMCVPGVMNQAVMITAEFVSNKWRPYTLGAIAIGFILGLLLLALIAYFFSTWKMVFIISSAPFLVLLLFYRFVPESFRWCRVKGKLETARANLETMAKWNGKKLPDDFKITPVSAEKTTSVTQLFRRRKMAVRTVVLSFVWVTMGIIYYGIILTADDLGRGLYLDFVLINLGTLPATFVGTFFLDYFGRKKTTMVAKFSGAILCGSIALVPRIGKVKIWRTVLAVGGKIFFHMSTSAKWEETTTREGEILEKILMKSNQFDFFCNFLLNVADANNGHVPDGKIAGINSIVYGMYVWSPELYPTNLRCTAQGFLDFLTHLGSATAPWIAKGLGSSQSQAPFVIMALLAVCASVALLSLPETKGRGLMENKDETEELTADEDTPDACNDVNHDA